MSNNQNEIFVAGKGVVSRRNQDGTVILMKMEDSNFFFKITGLAAVIWAELETPKSLAQLTDRYQSAEQIRDFLHQLSEKNLVQSAAAEAPFRADPLTLDVKDFGGLQEFDLEQIETEVLNESVYLDVFAGSDLRLKQDIAPIRDALEKVTGLNGVTFNWNPDTAIGADGVRHAGVIAQEVAAAMPELVRKDETRGILAVEYSKLNAYLIEAIKELNTLVRSQDQRIRDLEKRAH